jgi:hypothetical protein
MKRLSPKYNEVLKSTADATPNADRLSVARLLLSLTCHFDFNATLESCQKICSTTNDGINWK